MAQGAAGDKPVARAVGAVWVAALAVRAAVFVVGAAPSESTQSLAVERVHQFPIFFRGGIPAPVTHDVPAGAEDRPGATVEAARVPVLAFAAAVATFDVVTVVVTVVVMIVVVVALIVVVAVFVVLIVDTPSPDAHTAQAEASRVAGVVGAVRSVLVDCAALGVPERILLVDRGVASGGRPGPSQVCLGACVL